MRVWDQFLIRRTGQRMVTFVTDVRKLEDGRKVAAAVFAFRGTRLNKTGNLRADLHLLRDLNAEMVVTQRATKKIQNHIKRLQEQQGRSWATFKALLRRECGLELAVGPAQLVTSAYWTLRGASAFVAGKLGSTVTHVLQSHSMLHMTKAFDFETGLPKRCVKMVSWPLMDRLSRPFWDHLGRAALESFIPTKTTEGFLVMFDRNAMVEARIQCLPDYIEAQQAFPDRQDSLDFLTHNLFDGADWFDDEDISALNDDHGNLSMDEAATEAEIDSGAEDESRSEFVVICA
ncbi:hypothetical protein WJX82_003428 [Trebouxia sp. C0006]